MLNVSYKALPPPPLLLDIISGKQNIRSRSIKCKRDLLGKIADGKGNWTGHNQLLPAPESFFCIIFFLGPPLKVAIMRRHFLDADDDQLEWISSSLVSL